MSRLYVTVERAAAESTKFISYVAYCDKKFFGLYKQKLVATATSLKRSHCSNSSAAANAFVGHFEPIKHVWWQQNCSFCSSVGPKFYETGQEMSPKVAVSGRGVFPPLGSFMSIFILPYMAAQ